MTLRDKIDKILANALIVIMSIMVVNVLWQVFTRYVMEDPSSFTDELARYLMIWIGVLGAAYVSGKNMHVAINVLPEKFSQATQKKITLFVNLLIIVFVLTALVIGGLRLVYITFILDQTSPSLQIPLAVVYMVLPISGSLIIYYKFSDMLNK
ncbi:MAG: TRAP transporter small permease [Flavobacteriaceae bacterium]|nr:TRAP transporter small permease [Flavobacteriaceae bacterium]